MASEKFLTVYAVFDDDTQHILYQLQRLILKNNSSKGIQTMDIPFHISLGSFPTSEELMLKNRLCDICASTKSFNIQLNGINHFDNRVVFAEPETNTELIKLHEQFDNNYANGFPWHAHATLFMDNCEDNVNKALMIAAENFTPIQAKIVGLQLGEFFPTRIIESKKFKL